MRALRLGLLAGGLIALVAGCTGHRPRPSGQAPAQDAEQTEWEAAAVACEGGEVLACFTAGFAYQEGDGPARDTQRARALFERGCELGDPNACALALSIVIDEAPGSEAAQKGRSSLEQGCFEADAELACLLLASFESEGVWEKGTTAEDAALGAWSHACEQLDSMDGCFHLASALREWRPDTESERAFRTFRQACAFEHLPACRSAADALACGQGVGKDEQGAVRAYLAACRLGDVPSCSQAASFFAVLTDDAREALNVNLGPTLRLLAVRSAGAGLAEDAELLASKLPLDEAAFIRAGLALDAGRYDDARGQVEALRQARPEAKEAALFDALIAAAEAKRPLFEALVAAWKAQGMPDLRPLGLVEPAVPFWETDCWDHVRPWLDPEDAVASPALWALTLSFDGAPREILEAAVKLPEDAPLANRLGALAALGHPKSAERLSPAQQAARARLLRTFEAEEGTFAVFVRLGAGEQKAPFTDGERQALQDARGWAPPKETLRRAIHGQAAQLPEAERTHFGAEATLQALVGLVTVADAHRVAARAQASAPGLDPKARRKLGERLVALGEATLAGGWYWEVMTGAALIGAGAELTGEEAHAQRHAEVQRWARGLLGEGDYLPELGTWPSWRLREELARAAGDDEVGFKERLDARLEEK